MIKILVVEDERAISDLIRMNLEDAGYACTCVYDGMAAADQIETQTFDLVLLDIMLPNEDGLDILTKIRANKATAGIPIIMVTAKTSELDKVKGLDLGADDYITKPFGVMELISRVKALLRRAKGTETESQIAYHEILLDNDKHAVFLSGESCELTFKEFELLKYLLLNKGIVLSRDKIMDKVWGFEYEGESRTVDMHIKTLRQKLGEAGAYIRTVRNVGYMVE